MQATWDRQPDYSGIVAKLIIIVAITGILMITVTDHTFQRHGATAQAVINCWINGGGVKTLHNDTTGRDAHLCVLIDNGKKFGVVIQENDTVITAFLKEKMKSIEQVLQYMSNAGYR